MNRSVKVLAFIVMFVVFLPVFSLFFSLFHFESDLWSYFYSHMFLGILGRTFLLVLGVAIGSLTIGLSCAWICSAYDFPGRLLMSKLLILPLAIPSYIFAFVYIGVMDFSGPVQFFLRENFSLNIEKFFHFRSVWGLIIVMSLAFFPYVYLMAKNAFSTQPKRLKEVAMSLGFKPRSCFWSLNLPMARPWILAGLGLVVMETLADFGSVAIFNYQTFTLGIYKLWYGFFSWSIAAQLSSFLILFVFLFFVLVHRRNQRHFFSKIYETKKSFQKLRGKKAWMLSLFVASVLFFSLGLPMIQLIYWSFEKASFLDPRLYEFLFHSLFLAFLGSFLILIFSFFVALARRYFSSSSFLSFFLLRLCSFGYVLPGTVLAVGTVATLAFLDRFFSFDRPLFNNSLFGLFLAYCCRFLVLGLSSLEAAFKRIPRSLDESASSLGLKPTEVVFKVHRPLLKGGIAAAFIMSFVEIVKEMPMTLMIRPIGWDTLAVHIFQLTSEGEWEKAALPSLFITLMGFVAVFFFSQNEDEVSL